MGSKRIGFDSNLTFFLFLSYINFDHDTNICNKELIATWVDS